MLRKTLASVPAPFTLPVNTSTVYFLAEIKTKIYIKTDSESVAKSENISPPWDNTYSSNSTLIVTEGLMTALFRGIISVAG
jgi:hypothetical protein